LLKRAACRWKRRWCWRRFAAGAFRLVYGWFCVRLSGVYLAMLTLAFGRSAGRSCPVGFLHGGSNACSGLASPAGWQDHLLLSGARSLRPGIALLWRVLFSPFGYALRAGRDSPLRPSDRHRCPRSPVDSLRAAGAVAGLACVYAFSKGSISPSAISIAQSTDGLVWSCWRRLRRSPARSWARDLHLLRDEVARRPTSGGP